MLFFQKTAEKSISLKLLLYILAFSTFITLLTTAVTCTRIIPLKWT
jgi:hypothetical protein